MASKYEALADYLRAQTGDRLAMTFREVEEILGGLPPSARRYRVWWSNYPNYVQSGRGWLAAGWKTAQVSMEEERLLFVRSKPEERQRLDAARSEPAMRQVANMMAAAGGEENLVEVTGAIERYLAGEITESELGRVVRKHWGRRG